MKNVHTAAYAADSWRTLAVLGNKRYKLMLAPNLELVSILYFEPQLPRVSQWKLLLSSAVLKHSLTRRISTMLPFYYTFLILVLSSCVVAMPPERVLPEQVPLGPTRTTNYQDDWDSKYLIDNKDVRLPMGLWGRVEMSAEDTGEKWTAHAQYRDAAIQFVRGTNGVDKVQLRQIMRELLPNEPRRRRPREESYINEYRVNRTHRGEDHRPAVTKKILPEPLPIKTSGSYLHDTYWARNPDVLGKVSESLMIWKS